MPQEDTGFFVISDNANSHHALVFWLQGRTFNHFETGRKDKRGNPIIKLINKIDDRKFSKQGIICCLKSSESKAEEIILEHLRGTNDD